MSNKYKIISNTKIAKNTYEMHLAGDITKIKAPGQFLHIELPGFYLRRPISVCDTFEGGVVIIYKVFGEGTEYMTTLKSGQKLNILMGLGNGFDIKKTGQRPLIVGGGVGVPPLYLLAKHLIQEDRTPKVVLGFGSADEVFYKEKFEKLGCETFVTTVDGSDGIRGFVTDALPHIDFDYLFSCGPVPMLKALYNATDIPGQFSFEERMACGIGACMGCTCKTKKGYKRICKDGPVLFRDEIDWEQN